jgi:hypothetical protein
MFLVDIEAGRIIEDDEIKDSLADAAPYGQWLRDGMIKLSDLPSREHIVYPHKFSDSSPKGVLVTPKKKSKSSSLRWRKTAQKHWVPWEQTLQSQRFRKSRAYFLITSLNFFASDQPTARCNSRGIGNQLWGFTWT